MTNPKLLGFYWIVLVPRNKNHGRVVLLFWWVSMFPVGLVTLGFSNIYGTPGHQKWQQSVGAMILFWSETFPKRKCIKIIFQHQDEVGSLGKAIVIWTPFWLNSPNWKDNSHPNEFPQLAGFFMLLCISHFRLGDFSQSQVVTMKSAHHPQVQRGPSSRIILGELCYSILHLQLKCQPHLEKRQHSLPRLGWFFVGSSDLLRKFTNKILFFLVHIAIVPTCCRHRSNVSRDAWHSCLTCAHGEGQ